MKKIIFLIFLLSIGLVNAAVDDWCGGDSDGGNEPLVDSYIVQTGDDRSYDICEGVKLTEYYCNARNADPKGTTYYVDDCDERNLVYATSDTDINNVYEDSDGASYTTPGKVTWTREYYGKTDDVFIASEVYQEYLDECSDSNKLTEHVVSGGKDSTSEVSCSSQGTNYKCLETSNGAFCGECSSNSDCSSSKPYCTNNKCVVCTQDSHCSSGQYCKDDNTCTTISAGSNLGSSGLTATTGSQASTTSRVRTRFRAAEAGECQASEDCDGLYGESATSWKCDDEGLCKQKSRLFGIMGSKSPNQEKPERFFGRFWYWFRFNN